MGILAGVLGVLYGVFHGAGGVALLRAPEAGRGSGLPGAIPRPARAGWVAFAVIAIAGGGALILKPAPTALAVLTVGVLGIALLAIANGFWMKGRPTFSHHAVRVGTAVVVLALGIAAL